MPPDHERLRAIKTFPQLVKYLRDDLEWPIDTDSFEELTFEYEPEELGLDLKSMVKIKPNGIKQLRPLETKQPWGIFFIDFEPKRLPVVVLRRILRALVVKKRQSAHRSQQAVWKLHDLLFISSYGETAHRDITFAHFSEDAGPLAGDLPTLRVLGWDDEDTALHLDHAHRTLKENLRWPESSTDIDHWRANWSAAFTLRHREVIKTSQDLAIRLAELAKSIRKRVKKVLAIESETGPMRRLMNAFKESLIHDLEDDDFANTYAQTVTYGLLTARVSRHTPDAPAGLVAENLTDIVPITNPFLKDLLSTFLTVGGRKGKIDFDEIGINDVINALRHANMEAVLRDFGDQNPDEDPVVHFYEDFLAAYDRPEKKKRGVFYTPKPVVSYIVRSVHELLQTEFGLVDGLADTTTWGEMLKKHKDLKLPEIEVVDPKTRKVSNKTIDPATPFVQILDPATGTATFLVEVIDIIHKTMIARWKTQGHTEMFDIPRLWNEYVPCHLLPRLYGYELMMAPYAIAHMKIGLKLGETGYRFGSEERARIYLTNALEPPQDFSDRLEFDAPALAHEAKAVNDVKRHKRFMVVIGNPPYSGISSNMMDHAQQIVDTYKIVDGETLNERKLWLQDDYVKFIRTAQEAIDNTRAGIFGFITNHGYLDNPTFRGMRQSLLNTYGRIALLDLHGNANKKEKSPDGAEDKNVFDIRQGVAICLAVNGNIKGTIQHADLWGSRESKYSWLFSHGVSSTSFTKLTPDSPFYFFEPQNIDCRAEYDAGWKINEAMPVNCAGFITARDHFVIDVDKETLLARIADFSNPKLTEAGIRAKYFAGRGSDKYPDGDTRSWKVPQARKRVQGDRRWRDRVKECLYRPFDIRPIYWADWMVDWPRPEVMRHVLADGALALSTSRSVEIGRFEHALCTRLPLGHHTVSMKEVNYMFPLHLLPNEEDSQRSLRQYPDRQPNFAPTFLTSLATVLRVSQEPRHGLPKGVTAEEILAYFYAILYSPVYRSRYAEFLKIDFPRIALPNGFELFGKLSRLGGELVGLHVLESQRLAKATATYTGQANQEVEKVSYAGGTVWLDKRQTSGFAGVPEEVWNFHIGGYQVCHKWLKDRKGRTLSKEDIAHYQKIVVALSETIRIMKEIDETIEKHGGWPGAFVTGKGNSKSE